ncbi:zinc ribbon domain-containing protein [Candidatus Thorarchaeota archaeon]|nr:MAG: zinc ribbon domain-containing protein [Candidatus Thorarchaeota archaeon]
MQQTKHGWIKKLKIRLVASVPISANVYSVYVRQRKDTSTQVFSLDYGDWMRIFDSKGTLRSTRKWSSKVRCIAVADIEGEGKDALVGGVGNKVLVVDHRGSTIWNIRLESDVVACDARDIDGDDAAEVVAALQNNRVILFNNDKDAIFTRNITQPIADIWLEDITSDGELEVVVADKTGRITILTSDGYYLRELQLGDKITVFAILSYGERKLFVTGDLSSILRIWDIDGVEIDRIEVSNAPRAIATGVPDEISDVAYLVVSTKDRKVSFWEVEQTNRASKTERLILQEIESTKDILYRRAIKCGNCGAPTSPEASSCTSCGAKLEMMEEYVIEEYIRESINSITTKHQQIKLKDLDRILRKTLPRPATYNLRRYLQTMIKSHNFDGHIDGSIFVRTEPKKKQRFKKLDDKDISSVRSTLLDLLRGTDSISVSKMELETGVDRILLRRTLIILLGEGIIQGTLEGDVFVLDERMNSQVFAERLIDELRAFTK